MNVAVVTVSDRVSRGEAIDATGPAVIEAVTNSLAGSSVTHTAVVEDDAVGIAALLRKLADEDHLQLVLTCGGTGFTPRDVTPEATKAVIERECPGLVVAMITGSLAVTPHAMLSRPAAGIRGKTLIINLPGSPKGAVENLRFVLPALPHAIRLINQVEPTKPAEHIAPSPTK